MKSRSDLGQTWDAYSAVNSLKAVAPADFPFFDRLGLEKHHFVLDIGCGAGQDLSLIAQFSDNGYGMDISHDMLLSASAHHLRVCLTDCRQLPVRDSV
ncbi:MAG: class I SAM-dependent methyltransferase, partial [Gammaproteobacteria bacterium]